MKLNFYYQFKYILRFVFIEREITELFTEVPDHRIVKKCDNKLHWHLDFTFKEDASRSRKGNAPDNLNILRKIALQRVSLQKDKLSKKKRQYKASKNNSYIEEIIKI